MLPRSLQMVVLSLLGSSCGPGSTPALSPPTKASHAAPSGVGGSASVAIAPASPDVKPVVIVADPKALSTLEAGGFDLGSVLGGDVARSTAELARVPTYAALVATVKADLAEDRRADPSLGVGMRYAHRQLDERWLSSPSTRFELISVVNRLDRRVFAPEHCGEVRFIYRLAYEMTTPAGPVRSRAPFNVNVVHFLPAEAGGSCMSSARSWMKPRAVAESEEAGWLTSPEGPLSVERRSRFRPKSVEVNFQSLRWPSTVRPGLGGHAEYVLRAFHRVDGPPFLVPAPLENTIDVARLEGKPSLASEFVAWLARPEVLAAVDAGTVSVPEQFLAKKAVSVTPHGLARSANRPFRAALSAKQLEGSPLSSYRTVSTKEALLRRLDTLSCQGCHQSRSIAGFHLLGVEMDAGTVDRVAVPMSPHFHGDLERRRAYTRALADGTIPSEDRPPAERTPGDDGPGARCGLGDPGFASWTCREGLHCVRVDDDQVGVCRAGAAPSVGEACEPVRITGAAPRRDAARAEPREACSGARVCEATSVGFPGGACAGSCEDLPPGAVCGGIPLLVEFNGCLSRGTPFERCIVENTRPGALAACGFHEPCRDDYVCARTAAGGGACLPPYFLFQLRIDGHPL